MSKEEIRSRRREAFRQHLKSIMQQIDSLNESLTPGYEDAIRILVQILDCEALILVLVDLVAAEAQKGNDPIDHYSRIESALYRRAQLEWQRQPNRESTISLAIAAVVVWVDYLEVQHPSFSGLRSSLKVRLADYIPVAEAETKRWWRDARALMAVSGVPDHAPQEAGTGLAWRDRESWFKGHLATKGMIDWSDYKIGKKFEIEPHVLRAYRDGKTKNPREDTLKAIAAGFGIEEKDVPR